MIDFGRFQRLHPQGREITIELFRRAITEQNVFLAFTLLWTSFNGWMACVTTRDKDWEMLKALQESLTIAEAFNRLLNRDDDFRGTVSEFAQWWPIFNSHDAHKYLSDEQIYEVRDRDDFCRIAAPHPRIRRRPKLWVSGQEPRWADFLDAVYQVRCNFFHGYKSPLNVGDHALVEMSLIGLRTLLEREHLFRLSEQLP
jgi:hypothetical protein